MEIRFVLIAVFAILFSLSCGLDARGCGENNFCCKGQNNTCIGKTTNRRGREVTCYCDENCRRNSDCCEDYLQLCQLVHCRVSDWSKWSECSNQCGAGTRTSTRSVIEAPRNGGDSCPPLTKQRPCLGHHCIEIDHSKYLKKESARILPARFGRWRRHKAYDIRTDIRKNLYHHYLSNDISRKPNYCAKFEIIDNRKACYRKDFRRWAGFLEAGTQLCVECQPYAMKRALGMRCRGHGLQNVKTRWNAMNVPGCHGLWVRKSEFSDCTCNPRNAHSFIFA
ncbi:somatomedin-B and thrombospondin type-1 domain-containing protein-like [Tubulanus polymorphus]|uniref:somatomedin-B and thrombospondin type-1 domain-containing protein-like n=1 Tax=Tubulanus polymorphus TaxID=672921 RepID=UPI003DA1EFDD